MPRCVAAVAVLAALLAAQGASAGAITGTLWMGPHRPGATPQAREQRGVIEAVVYLEQLPEPVERALTTTGFWPFRHRRTDPMLSVVQRDRFEPRVAAVPVGTRVAFHNLDRVYHNVFSVSPAARFDLGKYAPGRTDTVQLARPGVVNLHCDIHPDELGYIVVTPNHAFTRPDSLGRFRLPRLPAGRYTVLVFHPRRGEIKRAVDVPKRGDAALELGF